MSGLDPMKPDDAALETFLRGEGPVRGAYRAAARELPPVTLDAAILAQAREAARAVPPPPRTARRAARRWQPAFATAAVLVLSLGVLLQVQRDPVALDATRSVPAEAPAAAVTMEAAPAAAPLPDSAAPSAAPAAPVTADTAAAEAAPRKAEKPAATPAVKDKPRTAAMPAPPAPPPPPAAAAPAMTMDAAPPPAQADELARVEAMMQAEQSARAEAMAESKAEQSRREQLAAQEERESQAVARSSAARAKSAAAPADAMAAMPSKSLRAPAGAMLMAAPDAASANAANAEAAIEHWAASCELPVALPQGPLQWRGLAASGWSAEASDDHHLAILRFSPTVKRAEINAVLGSLASRREFARSDCAVPLLRELRDDAGWALVCECAQTAGP